MQQNGVPQAEPGGDLPEVLLELVSDHPGPDPLDDGAVVLQLEVDDVGDLDAVDEVHRVGGDDDADV